MKNYREVGYHESEKQIMKAMNACLKNFERELAPSDYRYFDMWGTSYVDPHIILCGIPRGHVSRDFEYPDYIIDGRRISKEAMIVHLQHECGIDISLDMFSVELGIRINYNT